MGQKINPLGFRLGTNQSHHSVWFAKPKKYFEGIQEDKKIRDCIKNYIQKTNSTLSQGPEGIARSQGPEGIARIEIKKRDDEIWIIIHMGFPKLLTEDGSRRIKELRRNVKKELNCINHKLNITIRQIPTPYEHANLVAEFLAVQLENRVSFRKAMKKAIELSDQGATRGIRIQIAGRINGKEIARVEWTKEGRVPLQTIAAKIDYCSYPVRTIDGVLGIKIWIFLDEKI